MRSTARSTVRPTAHRTVSPTLRRAAALLLGGAALIFTPAFTPSLAGAETAAPAGTPSAATPSAAPAAGASAPSATPVAPRYAFAPVEGGALKLDRETGKVSLCAKSPAGFTCEAVPDSRDAYEAEIARLQKEVAELRRQLPGAPKSAEGPAPEPSDIDAAFDYAERVFRRLKALIQSLSAPDPSERI